MTKLVEEGKVGDCNRAFLLMMFVYPVEGRKRFRFRSLVSSDLGSDGNQGWVE